VKRGLAALSHLSVTSIYFHTAVNDDSAAANRFVRDTKGAEKGPNWVKNVSKCVTLKLARLRDNSPILAARRPPEIKCFIRSNRCR